MPKSEAPEYTINRAEGKVWVNGKHNCLGRFGPNGWEIYQDMNAPTEVIGTTKTLDVRKRVTNAKDWKDFVLLMKSHHNIDLSEEENPHADA